MFSSASSLLAELQAPEDTGEDAMAQPAREGALGGASVKLGGGGDDVGVGETGPRVVPCRHEVGELRPDGDAEARERHPAPRTAVRHCPFLGFRVLERCLVEAT